jgi:hypothetical protein
MKKPILFPDIHINRALFLSIHQFNLLPTRYIHASWLPDLVGAAREDIQIVWQKNIRAEKHCAALIIKSFCHGFIYDFSDSFRQVALMPAAALARLMVYTGLAIHARSIKNSISGPYHKHLSVAFGPEAYEFAVNRAPLLVGSYPFGFLKPKHADESDPQPGDILESGRRCLQTGLEGSPKPLVRRLCLKFPKNMHWEFKPLSNEAVITACRRLVQKIMKMELGTQWNTVSL